VKRRTIAIVSSVVLVLCAITAFAAGNTPDNNAVNQKNEPNIGVVALAATNAAVFSDIPSNAWYADAVD
jgi:hypothetical protein